MRRNLDLPRGDDAVARIQTEHGRPLPRLLLAEFRSEASPGDSRSGETTPNKVELAEIPAAGPAAATPAR